MGGGEGRYIQGSQGGRVRLRVGVGVGGGGSWEGDLQDSRGGSGRFLSFV